jgi:hypothetical protein
MKVIQVDNERARQLIELYTAEFCFPDVIKFVQDGAGNWVMSMENLTNDKFVNPDKDLLAKFLLDNLVSEQFKSITEVITKYGIETDYIQPTEII